MDTVANFPKANATRKAVRAPPRSAELHMEMRLRTERL
jgi:hypothetical protein